jgi:hypothetical protein
LLLTREERTEKGESGGTNIQILSSLPLAVVAGSPPTAVAATLSLALDLVLLMLFRLQALVQAISGVQDLLHLCGTASINPRLCLPLPSPVGDPFYVFCSPLWV